MSPNHYLWRMKYVVFFLNYHWHYFTGPVCFSTTVNNIFFYFAMSMHGILKYSQHVGIIGRFNDAMVFSRFRVVYHINDGFVNNITIFYGYSNTFCLTVPLSKTLKVTWIPKRSNVVNNIGYATVYECMLGDSSKLNHTLIANSSSNHSRRSHIGSISISNKITLIFLGCVHIFSYPSNQRKAVDHNL